MARPHPPDKPMRVAVASSGGRDSTALLHCTVAAARALGIGVVGLHVHHGLADDADAWLAQVRAQCRRWGAGFDHRRLDGRPGRGESIEAWARRGRYVALAEMAAAAGCGVVLLAHHRRDQAETWLLQALRGGGAAGLSAMPRRAERQGIVWLRPWLAMPRAAIDSYLARHRLRHAEDASNADVRLARNRLRLQVWPALRQAFPDAETALAAAAAQAQEAAALAAEVGAADLAGLRDGAALAVSAWLALAPARRRNALQAWLRESVEGGVPASLLQRLLVELPKCRAGAWPAPGAALQLYRDRLRVVAPAALAREAVAAPPPQSIDLSLAGDHPLPGWHGRFEVRPAPAGGVGASVLRALQLRRREGGEQFRLAPDAASRSLKKQFQARAVPAGERGGPLLFTAQGQIVYVPGLGIDAAAVAAPGEPQMTLRWCADGAPGARQRGGGR